MRTPSKDLAALIHRQQELIAELHWVSDRLAEISHAMHPAEVRPPDLGHAQFTENVASPPPPQPQPSHPPFPQPLLEPPPGPWSFPGNEFNPVQAPPPPGVRPETPPPPKSRIPFWERPGMVARVLGGLGVGVTLVGVALLLTLAWQYGYFGPPVQLAAAIALASALSGGGFLVHRTDARNAGSTALLATGIATCYLTIFMASAYYGYLPSMFGLVLASALAVAGLALAAWWEEQWLAVPILLGVIVLAPLLGAPTLLTASFILALVLASAWITGSHDWVGLRLVEVVPTAFTLWIIQDAVSNPWVVLTALFALIGVGLAVQNVLRQQRTLPVALAMMVLSSTPYALQTIDHPSYVNTGLLVGAALCYSALVLLPGARFIALGASGTAVGAAFLLLGGLVTETTTDVDLWVLILAVVYLAVAIYIGGVSRWIGLAFSGLGVLIWLTSSDLVWDYADPSGYPDLNAVAASALATGVPILIWVMMRRHHPRFIHEGGRVIVHFLGAFALFAVWITILQTGVVIGRRLGYGIEGLYAGHVTVTVLCIALSAIVLARALRSEHPMTYVYWGLALAGLAVGKLFLYDLGQQPALVRAVGFLIVGVSLLLIGTRYAKALAAVRSQETETESQAS